MALTEEVGKALRFLRKRKGMTQRAVAEAAEISKNLLSNWETGATAPSLNSLEKVMEVLEVDLLEVHNTIHLMAGKPYREVRNPAAPREVVARYGELVHTFWSGGEEGGRDSDLVESLLFFVGLLRLMARATRDERLMQELEELFAESATDPSQAS